MRYVFLTAMLCMTLEASAGSPSPFVINDPAGDDSGDGTLIYPQRSDFQRGDLDLLQLRISRDADGFWFEATLKNPIRDPGSVHATVGGDSLADSARKGFYQFNIDMYVDTDRIEGSGNRHTLPGRKVGIDAGAAWEKAVILTPRPEMLRQQFIDALAAQHPDRTAAEIQSSVDQSLFFPSRIKVRGKTIRYYVPAAFFGEGAAGGWAATVLVTGAVTTITADLSLGKSDKKLLDDLTLGVMQPAPGHPADTFGYSGHRPSPVVDVLGASAEQQARQLAGKESLTAVALGAGKIAGEAPMPAASDSAIPISQLLQPAAVESSVPATQAPAQADTGADDAIARRLQALQRLREQKLIDEAEYKQQRMRILNEL